MTKLCGVVANTKRMRLNRNRTPGSVFLYGVLSVVACTLLCESGSTGSIPVGYPNLSVV